MSQLLGMDVFAVRALGNQLRAAADSLRGTESLLTLLVGQVLWTGDDATQFRGAWDGDLRLRLIRIADALEDAARRAHVNATEQERTSAL